jgi:ribosome recycling factor
VAEAPDLDDIDRRMNGAMSALRQELASLRTGRASASMLDPVTVVAYGVPTPISQVATINVPEPRMIVLNVWDKSMVGATEKAISNSGLGVNPIVDGPLIRIPIPELNEERRRELAKVAGQYAEKARIAIRNVRRGGMDQVKKAKADGLSEDEQKKVSEQIQSLTDRHVKNVDDAVSAKEAEIMQV